MDLIVLPEAADVPCLAGNRENTLKSHRKYGPALLKKCAETARRCNAVLFVNAIYSEGGSDRNTTFAFKRQGEVVGHYFKKHLTPGEALKKKDTRYSFEFSEPTVITIEGVRYGFLTCYDFYEAFPNLARQNVDVIIGCSHQRSDTREAIEVITRFCAYNCNAYVVRSSVSMDVNSNIGGGSDPERIVDRAMDIGCQKVQLVKGHFDQAMIDKAHANNIRCNVFWSDDPAEAQQYQRTA